MIENMPKFARDRFYHLRSFVRTELFPRKVFLDGYGARKSQPERDEYKGKVKDLVDEATVVIFVFLMRKFLSEGTVMAEETVDLLEHLGIQGFSVGSVDYQGRNENVTMGRHLS